ncbi:MAG: hypothetical protein KGH53_02710 [Candidatus Micrarchaeota archaeon]|nr:hypothetical protein [Candidatus Micrarchaeota archaeon]
MMCERCKRDIFKYNTCNYCKRKICVNCMKSSRKVTKTNRIVVCRDCWTKMPKRMQFKSATVESA